MLQLSPDRAFLPTQPHFLHFAAPHRLTESDCSAETARSSLRVPGLALCLIWSYAVAHLFRTVMRDESMQSRGGVMPQTPTPKTIRPVCIACHPITAIGQHLAGARPIIPMMDREHQARAQPP
jgi:hypothetical protein